MNLTLGDAMVLWKQSKINGSNGTELNKKILFGWVCAHIGLFALCGPIPTVLIIDLCTARSVYVYNFWHRWDESQQRKVKLMKFMEQFWTKIFCFRVGCVHRWIYWHWKQWAQKCKLLIYPQLGLCMHTFNCIAVTILTSLNYDWVCWIYCLRQKTKKLVTFLALAKWVYVYISLLVQVPLYQKPKFWLLIFDFSSPRNGGFPWGPRGASDQKVA